MYTLEITYIPLIEPELTNMPFLKVKIINCLYIYMYISEPKILKDKYEKT